MHELRTLLAELESDAGLEQEHRLPQRLQALDRLDAYRLDLAEPGLQRRAAAACARLESINASLYETVRDDIRGGRGAGRLLQWLSLLRADARPDRRSFDATPIATGNDYDALDEVVSGILGFREPESPAAVLAPEMVSYQPTPARHIFAMISRSELGEGDVLMDLGAGLGHAPLLAAICTRAQAVGVELEPAYVACGRQVASSLKLANVDFVQADVRVADLSRGTVFYLYTPFKGAILREVLDRLREQARLRPVRVCTFGPCTPIVAGETWLLADTAPEPDRIVVFRSVR